MPFWRRPEDAAPESGLLAVVGLGNPGGRYADTRHNLGFMVVNALARRYDVSFRGSRHRADTARATIAGRPVLLALPVTYMNESGSAVQRVMSYYHLPLTNLLVVCDDIDLPYATLRLRPNGSSGGNGGLKSIIRELGTQDFARLRVGVGRPPSDAVGHVLSPFPPQQRALLPALVETAADAVETWLREGVEPVMNRFNRSWADELAAPSPPGPSERGS
ncbi:MAG: aminoacyl-tRNA hydrolase [Chloroflexi bacterium]|nr:aminoacyl-tRNA hydrolase [Chloroflexota bacterium]